MLALNFKQYLLNTLQVKYNFLPIPSQRNWQVHISYKKETQEYLQFKIKLFKNLFPDHNKKLLVIKESTLFGKIYFNLTFVFSEKKRLSRAFTAACSN